MAMAQISQLDAVAGAPPQSGKPTKVHDAAQQFEALLLAQILHSAHASDGGWLGTGSDSSGSCATDYAEQQLAAVLAQQGGLGLSRLIAAGLQKEEPQKPMPATTAHE